jgi:hypothetical protein
MEGAAGDADGLEQAALHRDRRDLEGGRRVDVRDGLGVELLHQVGSGDLRHAAHAGPGGDQRGAAQPIHHGSRS